MTTFIVQVLAELSAQGETIKSALFRSLKFVQICIALMRDCQINCCVGFENKLKEIKQENTVKRCV